MNATWTLSLYPRAWRRRYEPTFRSALEANDPGLAGTIDLVTGAALAHLRPDPALPDERSAPAPRPVRRDPRDSSLWTVLLAAHASLYTGVIVLLAIINLATNPDTLWFLFAAWGWGIAVAAHAGATFSRRSWLPLTALVSAVVAAGLVGINLASGGPAWSIWPVWALFSLVAILALHTSGRIEGFGAHVLVTVLGGLELAGVAIVAPDAAPDLLFTFGYWLAGLLVHALYRFGRPTLLQIHALVFVAFNVLFTIESAVEDTWWSVYPLVGWGIILTIHAIVALAPRRPSAGQWERDMHAVLAAGRASSPHIRQIRRQLHRRGFLAHLALFTAGAATLSVLNLLTPGDTWWMIWPVSVWLVLLAAHLGLLLVPPAPALGAWLAGGGGVIAWLAVLDRATGGGTWWYWPAGVWVIGILVVFPLSLDLVRMIDGRAPHPGR